MAACSGCMRWLHAVAACGGGTVTNGVVHIVSICSSPPPAPSNCAEREFHRQLWHARADGVYAVVAVRAVTGSDCLRCEVAPRLCCLREPFRCGVPQIIGGRGERGKGRGEELVHGASHTLSQGQQQLHVAHRHGDSGGIGVLR